MCIRDRECAEMNSFWKDAALIAAMGTVGFCAYKCMSPDDKRKLSRDAKRTMEDMCDVRHDMTRMAGTIKDTF